MTSQARSRAFLAPLALSACSLAACASNQAPEQAVQSAVGDGAIYAQIEAKFASIDPDSTLHVAVAVHQGDVSLSGNARSRATADAFASAAKSVGGVAHVASRINVVPGIPSTADQAKDIALSAAVVANLAAQAGINATTIGVSAHRGVVTLKGTAQTKAIASTLVAAAKNTPGTVRVVDDIAVRT